TKNGKFLWSGKSYAEIRLWALPFLGQTRGDAMRNVRLPRIFLATFCTMIMTIVAGGLVNVQIGESATFYVATTGSDSNLGSLTQPFRTLGKGVKILKPGDTLYIRAVTYPESLYNTIPGGSSWSAPVTVA